MIIRSLILLTLLCTTFSCTVQEPKGDGKKIVGGAEQAETPKTAEEKPVVEKKTGPKVTSEVKYTDLVENKCETEDSNVEEEWSIQKCGGVGGYSLQVVEGDLRQSINVLSPDDAKFELNLWSVVSNRPSTVGDKAEWRLEFIGDKKIPTALIVRYNVNADLEDTDKIVSYLTISKISPAGACVTAIIPPMKNANVEARKRAAKAQNSACLPTKN